MQRLIFTLAILLALEVYAYQAVRTWLRPKSGRVRRWGAVVYWVWAAIPVAVLLLNAAFDFLPALSREVRILFFAPFFMTYLGKVVVAAVLLIDDIRRGLGWVASKARSGGPKYDPSRSRFLSKAALVAGGIPVATLTYGIVRNAYRYRRFTHEVPVANLPAALDGFKIVQISDMHSGSWTKHEPIREAINLINGEDADLICFTGDMVNNRADEMLPFTDLFSQVRAKHGVYSTLGNHDYGDYERWPSEADHEDNMQLLYRTQAEMGWDLLRNEHRILDIEGAKLAVIGVENWSAMPRFPKHGDLAKAYAGTEGADFRLLLSHDPTHWDAQVRPDYPDIGLTLSGHTHGFQFGVEIPGFRWSPAQYLYEQWAGLYQTGAQFLNVNRGLGFLGYPGRVGILPEVTVLILKRATED